MSEPIINNPDDDRAWCAFATLVWPQTESCIEEAVEFADRFMAERRKRMAPTEDRPKGRCKTCLWWKQSARRTCRICAKSEDRTGEDYGYVGECGPYFGCVRWEPQP